MRIAALIALCLVGISASARGAPPKAVILGPTTGSPGDILILDASLSEGVHHFKWRVRPELPNRLTILPMDGMKRCQITSVPGVYSVTLGVSNDEGLDLLDWIVTIPGKPPTPPGPPTPVPPQPQPVPPQPTPPGPTPGPEPQPVPPVPPVPPTPPAPVLPDGEFAIAKPIYSLALQVQSPARVAEAQALADELERIAGDAEAGKLDGFFALDTARRVAAEVAKACTSKLAPNFPAWEAVCLKPVNARINELFDSGRLNTAKQWAVMLREAIRGLRAVK